MIISNKTANKRDVMPTELEMQFTGKRYAAKTMDGRDIFAQELKDSNFYYIFYISGKKKGDRNIVHTNNLRHLKEMKR